MFHVDWPRRLAFASAVSIAVGAALPAAVALASRAPRPGERKAIIYALTHAGGRLALPTGTTVGSIRISTLDADYASATLINSRVGDANALLEKEGRAPSAWAVI